MHLVIQFWLIRKISYKIKSLNTKQYPAGLSYRIICQVSPFLTKMSKNRCTHQVWTVPLFPKPLRGGGGGGGGLGWSTTQNPKIYSFSPSEKSVNPISTVKLQKFHSTKFSCLKVWTQTQEKLLHIRRVMWNFILVLLFTYCHNEVKDVLKWDLNSFIVHCSYRMILMRKFQ